MRGWVGDRERERERETERQRDRETDIDMREKHGPVASVCTLIWDGTRSLLVYGTKLQPAEPPGARAPCLFLIL